MLPGGWQVGAVGLQNNCRQPPILVDQKPNSTSGKPPKKGNLARVTAKNSIAVGNNSVVRAYTVAGLHRGGPTPWRASTIDSRRAKKVAKLPAAI